MTDEQFAEFLEKLEELKNGLIDLETLLEKQVEIHIQIRDEIFKTPR